MLRSCKMHMETEVSESPDGLLLFILWPPGNVLTEQAWVSGSHPHCLHCSLFLSVLAQQIQLNLLNECHKQRTSTPLRKQKAAQTLNKVGDRGSSLGASGPGFLTSSPLP